MASLNIDAEAARAILTDIENRSFKAALNKVDKKLKKTDSDYFKALQTLIKAHIGQVSEKGAILLQLEELLVSKRVLTDLDAIQFYDEALELILPKLGESWSRIIGYLRWQLVKSTPKDADAGRACFRACLAKEDYEHARHIANSLEKNFPGNHEYVFWNIATMFLYSQYPGYPEKERKLYGALAEGLIRKLADATIKAANSSPLPVRCIHKPQELLLMDTILRSGDTQKKNPVRLSYLQSPFVGPESTIAKGEWRLWILKLELLKNDPELLFQVTKDLLKRARTKDKDGKIPESRFSDFVVWKSYIDAALTNKSKYKNEVEAEVKAHLDPKSGIDKSWSRNASLASLMFSFAPLSSFSNIDSPSKTDLIMQYLRRYGDANMAYTDLKAFVEALDSQDLTRLLPILIENRIFGGSDSDAMKKHLYPLNQEIKTASGITKLVNVYKLIFLITSSIPEHSRRISRVPGRTVTCARCSTLLSDDYCGLCLTQLTWGAVKSYGLAMNDDGRITSTLLPTDLHPADDLCILSATCLAKLSIKRCPISASEPLENPAVYHLLQAAVLLEYAWSHSKANSQIALVLTRLYSFLGCGSLAMRAYQRLGVKQVQNATLSHYMFDGISTLHPHPFSSDFASQPKSVIEELRDQQQIYKNSPKQISNKIWSSFEHNNYNTIFELEQVKKALSYNVSALMSVVESRKVSRLIQPNAPLTTSSHGFNILPFDIEDTDARFSNQNDYDAMPNFEMSGDESPLARLSRASQRRMPFSEYRIHMDLFTEKFLTLVDPIADSVSANSARLWLDWNIDSIYEKILQRKERINFRFAVYYAMTKIVQGVSAFENDLERRLSERLSEIERLLYSTPATQETLESLYVTFEVGTTVRKLDRYLTRTELTGSQIQLHESLELAERLVKAVIDKSSTIKRDLDEGGWIDRVLKSVFQGDPEVEDSTSIPGTLRGVVNDNFMEEWAGQVVDSWKDSIKGFAYFKSG